MNTWIDSDVGRAVASGARATLAVVRRAWGRHRERRRLRLAYETLVDLDDRTLRDLGFDRSEAMSVAAELTAAADRTRLHARPVATHRGGSCALQSAGCAAS